jgi:threonine/homoserine/homoserine lactone efflux protein
MPETTTFLLFAAAALALVAIPGPNLVYIATRSVSQGPSAGFASALGVEVGTLVHVGAATVGLSALIVSSATAFSALKYLGAAYLLYLGVRTLISRHDAAADGSPDRAAASLRRVFGQGVLVNVLNPKVALFFLAFLPQFVDPARGGATMQTLVLGAAFFAIALSMDLLYVLAAGALGRRMRRHAGGARLQRHVTAGIYLALGAFAGLAGGHARPS